VTVAATACEHAVLLAYMHEESCVAGRLAIPPNVNLTRSACCAMLRISASLSI
jgi:hypothetical protein